MGWSESEERFDVQPSDFTAVISEDQETHKTDRVIVPSTCQHPEPNYFYERLGFEVGLFFEGEKKIYHPKNK